MNEAARPARTNRAGDPCPPWCTEQHEEGQDGIHRTDPAAIDVDQHNGHLSTRAGMFGGPPEIVVHAVWSNPGNGCAREADGNLYLLPADAGELAALLEVLARATPEQHRELAEAIRRAAAQVTGGGEGQPSR